MFWCCVYSCSFQYHVQRVSDPCIKCAINKSILHTFIVNIIKDNKEQIFSVSCFIFCPQFYGAPDVYESMLKYLNIVFTGLFTLECILKIIAFNPLVSCLCKSVYCAVLCKQLLMVLKCSSLHLKSCDLVLLKVKLISRYLLFSGTVSL